MTAATAEPAAPAEPWRAAWMAFREAAGFDYAADRAPDDELDAQWIAAWKAAAQAAVAAQQPQPAPASASQARRHQVQAAPELAGLIQGWRDSIAELEAEPMDLANTVECETLRSVIRQVIESATAAGPQPAPELAADAKLGDRVAAVAAGLEDRAAVNRPSKVSQICDDIAASLRRALEGQ